jgi:hypothetical protein
MLPALVAHADWSIRPNKRWLAVATLQPNRSYRAHASRTVGPLETFWERFGRQAGSGPALLGFDFPIGLPRAYAERAGIADFVVALKELDERFYTVAGRQDEICLGRPFYPMRPGGCRRQQLLDGLGLGSWSDLLRRCERPAASGPAACAVFWTLGGQQVGKAAISGWRDLLVPALRKGPDLALWPFQGSLDELLARHRFVVAETYPAQFYRHLGLDLKGGKGSQAVRWSNAAALFAWAETAGVCLDPALVDEIEDGFGPGGSGDDRFDAVVGLFGILDVALDRRSSGAPEDPIVHRVEGWILGQSAS